MVPGAISRVNSRAAKCATSLNAPLRASHPPSPKSAAASGSRCMLSRPPARKDHIFESGYRRGVCLRRLEPRGTRTALVLLPRAAWQRRACAQKRGATALRMRSSATNARGPADRRSHPSLERASVALRRNLPQPRTAGHAPSRARPEPRCHAPCSGRPPAHSPLSALAANALRQMGRFAARRVPLFEEGEKRGTRRSPIFCSLH